MATTGIVPIMRLAWAVLTLSALTATAGEGGVWTGYVNGFVRDPPSPVGQNPVVVNPSLYNQQLRQGWLVAEQYAALQRGLAWQRLNQSQTQGALLPSEQQQLAVTQQQLAAQNELLLKQQLLAAQQQQAALTQQLAVQQRAIDEQKAAAVTLPANPVVTATAPLAPVNATPAPRVAPPPVREPAHDPFEGEAKPEKAAAPEVKGPDILRWTDSEGVVHFSTKPPRDASIKYKNITASTRGVSAVVERQKETKAADSTP